MLLVSLKLKDQPDSSAYMELLCVVSWSLRETWCFCCGWDDSHHDSEFCVGTFREDNFQKAIGALTEAAAEAKGRPGANSGKGNKKGSSKNGPSEKPDIYKIVRMCMERNYDPLIVFSFSKKECENLAKQVCFQDGFIVVVMKHL